MNRATKTVLLGLALTLAGGSVQAGEATNATAIRTVEAHRLHRAQWPAGVVVDGINNEGWIVGHWTDKNGVSHIFLLNPFVPALSNVAVHDTAPAVMLDNFSG